MKLILMSIAVVLLQTEVFGTEADVTCTATQYVELGMSGIVNCRFNGVYFGVFWYNSTDYTNTRPIIYLQNSEKGGRGYTSGEFDIYANGSLIINNATLQHDHVFTVIMFQKSTDAPSPIFIQVVVYVKPAQVYPQIDNCGNERICVNQVSQKLDLRCRVSDARPAAQLVWLVRSSLSDLNVTLETLLLEESLSGTTIVKTTYNVQSLNRFALLICKETSSHQVLKESESWILLENSLHNVSNITSVIKYIEIKSKMELLCSESNMLYLAWGKIKWNGSFSNLAYSVPSEQWYKTIHSSTYHLGRKGSLIALEVGFQHEGIYACLYGDGTLEEQRVYEVFVYVAPMPAYPVVDGCSHVQYCVLDVKREGVLTCSLKGIRPRVELEWRVISQRSDAISFSNKDTTITEEEGRFNIITRSKFYITHDTKRRITVACAVIAPGFETFNLSTTLDLLYLTDSILVTPSERTILPNRGVSLTGIIAIVLAVLFLLAVFGLLICFEARHNRPNTSLKRMENPENIPMIVGSLEDDKARKQEIFIDQLRRNYLDTCETFLPIPFLPEKKYRIDEIFVDSGIEVFTSKSGRKKTWQKLESYHNILTLENNPTRIILEGDPGFGKSTVSLRLAYDWCYQNNSSAIFILLKLRNFTGTDSISQAIKSSLLPLDSSLSEEDIQNIILLSKKVTIILDGLDKYPTGSDYHNTVVKSIMMNKILTNAVVILTTRPLCLPVASHPSTVTLRLTGFNTNSQLEYIRKAIRSTENHIHVLQNIVERLLQENPVLSAICQVPIFFVHLVHITHEDNIGVTAFPTVTSFFSNVINCFDDYSTDHFLDDKLSLDSANVQSVSLKTPHNFDEMIFSGLLENHRRIFWEKDMFIDKLGEECYKHYLRVGLFCEEDFKDEATSRVRFYHNIFCEWFAGLHLSRLGKQQNVVELQDLLQSLNPMDLQYVFRFACGLSTHAAEKIIKYLENCKDGQKFAILCIMEQEKQDKMSEKVINTVKSLCQSPISINSHESRLLHVSTLELLKIASSLKIPIKLVWLTDMKTSTDHSKQKLQFKSGLVLEKLDTLLQLSIGDVGRTFSNGELIETLHYAKSCSNLNTLRFRGCILPLAIDSKKLPDEILKRKLTVEWSPVQKNRWYRLNLKTGQWEMEKIPVIEKEYSEIIARVRSLWKAPSPTSIDTHNIPGVSQELTAYLGKEVIDRPHKLRKVVERHCLSPINMDSRNDLTVQRSIIDLLKFASECKIHIECVWLVNMNCQFCQNGLNLLSGLILPTLETLKQLSILEQGRNYSEEELVGIIKYASFCPVLSNLRFRDCFLPQNVNSKKIDPNLQKRNLLVEWKVSSHMEASYHLNLYTGKWEFDEKELTNKEYRDIVKKEVI